MTDVNRQDSQESWADSSRKLVLQVTSDVQIEVVDILDQDMPFIWQEIYLNSRLYLSRGADDFMWGRATVNMVKVEKNWTVWFSVKEKPETTMTWLWHRKWQEELKKRFWDQRARPDPDHRPEFNRWD